MKVDTAIIENFKRIKLVELKPEGSLIVIGGKNGQGKTSVLDALMSALSGKKTTIPHPVRTGEAKSTIVVQMDDGITIRQYYTEAGTYGLSVTSRDGMSAKAPTEWLARFWSKLSFDPLEFSRMHPLEQGETLRRLLGLDFAEMDKAQAMAFASRTNINRDVRDLEGELASAPDISAVPTEERSLADLLADARKAEGQKRANDAARTAAKRAQSAVEEAQVALERAQAKLADALRAKGEADAVVAELPPDPDLEDYDRRVREAETDNANIRAAQRLRERLELLAERRRESDAYTAQIEAIIAEKRRLIASAEMPVPELAFAEDGAVLYKGVEFSQAAASEQIRVSASIGMAMNPAMKVMLIRDGSLLDDDSLAELQALADAYDAQVFLERVGTKGASIVLEDGEIAHDPLPFED